jgi:hypothetical protein
MIGGKKGCIFSARGIAKNVLYGYEAAEKKRSRKDSLKN